MCNEGNPKEKNNWGAEIPLPSCFVCLLVGGASIIAAAYGKSPKQASVLGGDSLPSPNPPPQHTQNQLGCIVYCHTLGMPQEEKGLLNQ